MTTIIFTTNYDNDNKYRSYLSRRVHHILKETCKRNNSALRPYAYIRLWRINGIHYKVAMTWGIDNFLQFETGEQFLPTYFHILKGCACLAQMLCQFWTFFNPICIRCWYLIVFFCLDMSFFLRYISTTSIKHPVSTKWIYIYAQPP